MAPRIRTLTFLPEIFKTETNTQFLQATLDQLTAQPNLERIEGYVGSKFGYGVDATKNYVLESTKPRTDYQLAPAVVFTKTNNSTAQDFISYPGIIDALKAEGGVTNDHSRLFGSQIYSWDSFADLDKITNFNQYYWLPEGPEAVTIASSIVYSQAAYEVTDEVTSYAITVDGQATPVNNPNITLMRGGSYTFKVSQGSPFWIQGSPGLTGYSATQTNLQTRDVVGVTNNGASTGEITFDVPSNTAQSEYTSLPNLTSNPSFTDFILDFVSTTPFADIDGKLVSEFVNGIDGVTSINEMNIMFYGTADHKLNFYTVQYDITSPGSYTDPVIRLIAGALIPENYRITAASGLEYSNRSFVKKPSADVTLIPYLSTILDTLYYQDGTSPSKVGIIKIIDSNSTHQLDITDIIGQKAYTSVNGVTFTNGLKVTFVGDVYPLEYKNTPFYVEGVGTAIELLPVTDFVAPELFTSASYIPFDTQAFDIGNFDSSLYIPLTPDYFTIARNASSKNAWSRSNRWFHVDVINATATHNNKPELATLYTTTANKAKRPIIEFYPNIRLFNSGVVGKNPVDFIDFRSTDAFADCAGKTRYHPDVASFTDSTAVIAAATTTTTTTINLSTSVITGSLVVGQSVADAANVLPSSAVISALTTVTSAGFTRITGATVTWSGDHTISTTTTSIVTTPDSANNYELFDGARIIFAADTNAGVRNKIYQARLSVTTPGQQFITLTETNDSVVNEDDQTFVYRGYQYAGKDVHYLGGYWSDAQQKSMINQAPLFDVFDDNGISFGDTSVYAGSSFKGTKLFAYGIGSGTDDSVLGFPLRYGSVNNIGDISFDISLNIDTFSHVVNSLPVTQKVNTGFVHHSHLGMGTIERHIGWQSAIARSEQYQIFDFPYYAALPKVMVCDVAAKSASVSKWPTVKVYMNNVLMNSTEYTLTIGTSTTTVTLLGTITTDTAILVAVLSDQVSAVAYYDIPTNFNSNPLNAEMQVANVGDIRRHYQSIFHNSPDMTGDLFGSNNYRDLPNQIPYGTSIIQNSASLVLPGIFLRKKNHNLFNALLFNSREYLTFKSLLTNTVANSDYTVSLTPSDMLDDAMIQITAAKSDTGSFFWSDMLPSKAAFISHSYFFANSMDTSVFPLSRIYDYTTANYHGVLVYLTRKIAGRVRTIQLVRDIDYTIETSLPNVTVTRDLAPGDKITVKEFNQTYGSYVPNTPTKMGMYPASVPGVVLDDTFMTPTYFIRGHDGSLTKLYGDYDSVNNLLVDFRDQVLLEFENRIYNNLKISAVLPISEMDVMPGFFRDTPFSYDEMIEVYSPAFLNWVGQNRIDYKSQVYSVTDEFTYNYYQTKTKAGNVTMTPGYWRGVYTYLYDTCNPHTAPWEMLGHRDMPSWWTAHYGAAPYTSDNLVMWTDLANGLDWNNGDPVTITSAIRPTLLSMLPVDSSGNLLSPAASMVGNSINASYNRAWKVGDMGPAEAAYRRSSSWPFDLMRIFALTQPAQFFNLGIDLDTYKYSAEFDQNLVNNRSHLVFGKIQVYGSGLPKTSYLNWIVDYEKQMGIDATTSVSESLRNIDVRLVYRLAGFSDKNMLKFYVEKGTPNNKNSSLLIPDDSFNVLLYDNQSFNQITYSGVVIQITTTGFKVYGNSQAYAYFKTLTPKINGNYDKVTIENISVQLANDYFSSEMLVPYGTEFASVQEVCQFLENYGRYLVQQGCKFDLIENGLEITWRQMVAEFVYWVQQGWEVGSLVNINPAATKLTIDKDSNIVQPLTLQQQNFVLNQDLYPIQASDLVVTRNSTLFSVSPLRQGDTISYGVFNVSAIEHGVVFDNVTVFDDVIYNLSTGLRQSRIILKGTKTAAWDGSVDAQGFILNQDNILDWDSNTKYTTGSIVKYKNKYWIATKIIQAALTFEDTSWKQTDYNTIQKGLLPNPSTRSYESILYYDANKANLENDADLLSFSLIGYRPREYLNIADLSDVTQLNVYRNLIKNKGTAIAANTFKGSTLSQDTIDYDIYENWAIKTSSFGGVMNSNFIDVRLNESLMTGKPSIIGLTNGSVIAGTEQAVPIQSLYNYGRVVTDVNVLPTLQGLSHTAILPDAGYVNFDDVKMSSYYYSGMSVAKDAAGTVIPLSQLYVRDYVWLANHLGTWQVYTPVSLGQITTAKNNLNGTATITFAKAHSLAKYQPFAIVGLSNVVDGYHTVATIIDGYRLTINLNLPSTITSVTGVAVGFAFQKQRVDTPANIGDLPLAEAEFIKNKVWVDEGIDGNWAVYRKSINYLHESSMTIDATGQSYGSAVAYTTRGGYLIGNSVAKTIQRYTFNPLDNTYGLTETITGTDGFGKIIAHADNRFVVASDATVTVYELEVSQLVNSLTPIQTIASAGVTSIALSGDTNWLYLANATGITLYHFNGTTYISSTVLSTLAGQAYGKSITTNYYGDMLVVGAPYKANGSFAQCGAVYVYSRFEQRHEVLYGYTSYDVLLAATQGTDATLVDVYVNGTEISTYTLAAGKVTITSSVTAGDIVRVSGNSLVLVQEFASLEAAHTGVQFGNCVTANQSGNEILVGAPFELVTQTSEGAVYRFTDGGADYGTIIGTTAANVLTQGTLLINGYAVTIPVGNATAAATAINFAKITNVQAVADSGILTIGLINLALAQATDKLTLTATTTALIQELGIQVYTPTQTITNIHSSGATQFGSLVKFNDADSIVISAPSSTRFSGTMFDFTDDEHDNDTVFDNNTTRFVDEFKNAGSMYMYDYLGVYNETLSKPGKFVYAQSVNDIGASYGLQPMYGYSVDFHDNRVVVGTPGQLNGTVTTYVNATGVRDWSIFRAPSAIVDINRIQDIQLYSAETNTTLDHLDFIDPLQGKILGAARENIDVVSNIDPAGYTTGVKGNMVWGNMNVGQTWFDTSTTLFVNYHQDDLVYNSKHWGTVFPGSDVAVYTWVSSSTPPASYQGPGTPYDVTKYSIDYVVSATGTLVPFYCFWARNTNVVYTKAGKTLSDSNVQSYIASPLNSGVSYFAPLLPSAFALYNSAENINHTDSILHVGYANGVSDDVSHSLHDLIRTGNKEDFLPGLPSESTNHVPESLYDRLLDSLCGVDTFGAVVPNPYLPKPVQYGILARPNQSMFIDRFGALKNYLMYANAVMLQYPIAETKQPSMLMASGPFYDTTKYWSYVDWWATGYSSATKAIVQVAQYADLSPLAAYPGLVAQVASNGDGKWETYIYDTAWTRIGLQSGTIEFSSLLWDYAAGGFGFSNNFFDTTPFSEFPSEETRQIVRSLTEEIYIEELAIHRNKSLILLFEYIQNETTGANNYLPWLNKTSFVDVSHTIRELKPSKVFQSDNNEFLEGYLNEVKPYHVVIKEFLFKYTNLDTFTGVMTDFDLPATFDATIEKFVSPALVNTLTGETNEYLATDPIWTTTPYSSWYAEHGLSLTGLPDQSLTTLSSYIALNSAAFSVDNAYGFPTSGIIKVDDEHIGYSVVDRNASTLSGLSRGANGTTVTTHVPGTAVIMDLPPVILLDGGREYVEPPKIIAYLDPSTHAAPLRPAVLQAVMNLDQILRIDVIDPGLGYDALPEILIDPAKTAVIPSSSTNTNIVSSNITMTVPWFVTGDMVRYETGAGTTAIGGLVSGQYYYVGVLETTPKLVLALYSRYADAVNNLRRVSLTTLGTGPEHLFHLTARAIAVATAEPIRENRMTLRFDRSTYKSHIQDWTSGGLYGSFFAGTMNNSVTISSSSISMESSQPSIDNVLSSGAGVTFEIVSSTSTNDLTWSSRTRILTATTSAGIVTIANAPGGPAGSPDVLRPWGPGDVGPMVGFYVGMPIKFNGGIFGGIVPETIYYVGTMLTATTFTLWTTPTGGIPTLTDTATGVAPCSLFVGELTNTAVVTIDYPGILQVTATTSTTNAITVPMTLSGQGGTKYFYVGLPVYFTGPTFGGIVENEQYHVTTIIDREHFTLSKTDGPLTLPIISTTDAGDLINLADLHTTYGLFVDDRVIFTDMRVNAPDMITGVQYTIRTLGNTDYTLYGAEINEVGLTFTATSAPATVTAGSFVIGTQYRIKAIGNTDFTLIGASANEIGLVFAATGVGTGTGTAYGTGTVNTKNLGGLIAGTTYYISKLETGGTSLTVSTAPGITPLALTTAVGTANMTSQQKTEPLTTSVGSMTLNVGLPVHPGQIDGQQFTFYSTSGQFAQPVWTLTKQISLNITGAVANSVPGGNYLSISNPPYEFAEMYVKMPAKTPISMPATYSGVLAANTTYYVNEIGSTHAFILSTNSSDVHTNSAISSIVSGSDRLVTVTCATHTFVSGDFVTISGVTGETRYNGSFTIIVLDANTFTYTVVGMGAPAAVINKGSAARHWIVLDDATGFYPNMSVTLTGAIISPSYFNGTTWVQSIAVNTVYYIKTVDHTNNRITLGVLPDAGIAIPVADAVSPNATSLQISGTPWIRISDTVGGAVKVLSASTAAYNDITLLQTPDTPAPIFDVSYKLGGYRAVIREAGNGWAIGNQVTILGSALGGTSPANDMVITINEVSALGEILSLIITGDPADITAKYYLKVISMTECEVYSDPLLSIPVNKTAFEVFHGIKSTTITATTVTTNVLTAVSVADFSINDSVVFTGTTFGGIESGRTYYIKATSPLTLSNIVGGTTVTLSSATGTMTMAKAGDFVLLPEPFYFQQSLVKYNHKVYQCIISNNDAEFIFGKWELLDSGNRRLNALDRINGYYEPTVNMPGNDITQLLDGVEYPNSIYKGNAFKPEDQFDLDVLLSDKPFYPTEVTTTSVLWNGTTYIATANTPTYSAIINSTDAVLWNQDIKSGQPLGMTDIVFSGDLYVATTTNLAMPILTSVDGLNWSATGVYTPWGATQPFTPVSLSASGARMYSVTWHDGLFVAVGDVIMTSTDGIHWNETYKFWDNGLENVLLSVQHTTITTTVTIDQFIAVGYGAGTGAIIGQRIGIMLTSLDGQTWLPSPMASTTGLAGIAASGTTNVVVGNDNAIYWYEPGSNWTLVAGLTGDFTDVIYTGSLFVAIGDSGVIYTSSNGKAWTVRTSVVTTKLNGIAYNSVSSEYVIVGEGNTILKSADAITWTNSSLFALDESTYTVQGDPFTTGFGPEELVPGVIQDQLALWVTTRPGTNWPVTLHGHTGYNVVSIESVSPMANTLVHSFDGVTSTPASVAVSVFDSTGLTTTLHTTADYTVDWLMKTITVVPAYAGATLRIDVYEVGNGDQLVKSNSHCDPIHFNPTTGFHQITLNCQFSETIFNGSGIIQPGTATVNIDVLSTSSVDNTIQMATTGFDSLQLNMPITFVRGTSASTAIGGLTLNTRYFIKHISASTYKITVSASQTARGAAGPVVTLTNGTVTLPNQVLLNLAGGVNWTWSPPMVLHNGTPMTPGYKCTVMSTSASYTRPTTEVETNIVMCDTTTGFNPGDRIHFGEAISNITAGPTYYVREVIDLNRFTISASYGGAAVALADVTKKVVAVTNDFAFGRDTNQISAVMLLAEPHDANVDYISYSIFGETQTYASNRITRTSTFTATGGSQTFQLLNTVPNPLVTVNGTTLLSSQYVVNHAARTVTLTASAGQTVVVLSQPEDRIQYNYSMPVTQTFTGTGAVKTFVVDGWLGSDLMTNTIGVDNPANAIVEINGLRQMPSVYRFDLTTNSIVFTSAPALNATITVTTFNETDRQYLHTAYLTGATGRTVAPISNLGGTLPIVATSGITSITSSVITVASTTGFVSGQYAIFSAGYGGIVSGVVYQINTVGTGTFTINNIMSGTPITLSNSTNTGWTVSVYTKVTTRVVTSAAHTLVSWDKVRIDGVAGATELNNSVYFARLISSTQLDLFAGVYDQYGILAGFAPVQASAYGGGGFIWKDKLHTLTTTTATVTELNGNKITAGDTLELATNTPVIFTNMTKKSGYLTVGKQYTIKTLGDTNFMLLGAKTNAAGVVFTATGTGIITAGSFVATQSYTIVSLGTTNFTSIGATGNDVGRVFTASGAGTGTGTAYETNAGTVEAQDFGGLVDGTTYYVRDFVPESTSGTKLAYFTVSATYAGPIFSLTDSVTTDAGAMTVTQWEQTNVDRLWVTIDGKRVPSSKLRLNPDNNLSILAPMTTASNLIITSMVPTASPNESIYLNNVTKDGVGSIHRVNTHNRTWLTQPLLLADETMVVADVERLLNKTVRSVQAPAAGPLFTFTIGLDVDKYILSQVIIFNATRNAFIDPSLYSVSTHDLSPIVVITSVPVPLVIAGTPIPGQYTYVVAENDNLIVTTLEGNTVYVAGEQIRFRTVDINTNTISNLQRGANGTAAHVALDTDTEVFSMLSQNMLLPSLYNDDTWSGRSYKDIMGVSGVYSTAIPQQTSTTVGAQFLLTDIMNDK